MPEIYTFPAEWYDKVVSQKFTLRNLNQSAARPWGNAGTSVSVRPQTQVWMTEVTMAPQRDPELQDMDAFFARLKGRSAAFRMSNAARLRPWNDRNAALSASYFSDGSSFSDGSGFANGLLPPEVIVSEAAARGSNYITLGGFPADTANVLRRGDLLQVKPNGVLGTIPHLYKAMYGGDSDASGNVGFEIEPLLRATIAAGDIVSLFRPTTIFRMADDNQGDIEVSGAGVGSFGFSAVEALDLIP